MGVFARRVAEFRVYARPVFDWRVCVLACVRSLGGGGTVWSRRPLLPRLACLRAHALAWALLACARLVRLPPACGV